MSAQAKTNWHSNLLKIFQVSTDEEMGKYSKLVEFLNLKPFSNSCSLKEGIGLVTIKVLYHNYKRTTNYLKHEQKTTKLYNLYYNDNNYSIS